MLQEIVIRVFVIILFQTNGSTSTTIISRYINILHEVCPVTTAFKS